MADGLEAIRPRQSQTHNGSLRVLCTFLVHLLPSAILFSALAGCGSDNLPIAVVTGQVLQDGTPVTHGQVIFRPETGPAATGDLDSEGRFQLFTYARGDGAVVGKHSAIVVPKTQGMTLSPGQSPTTPVSTALEIPQIYQRHETSPLRFEVTADANYFTLELLP
ncbi:MAG: hypothetical protein WD030_11220 [Pirellulales bacterium]